MDSNYIERERLERAKQRVKRIKGFYTHLTIYLFVNTIIVIININNLGPDESYFQWQNFITLFFWGIGLLVHGLSVFLPNMILGKNWEERKIKELMDRDKQNWE